MFNRRCDSHASGSRASDDKSFEPGVNHSSTIVLLGNGSSALSLESSLRMLTCLHSILRSEQTSSWSVQVLLPDTGGLCRDQVDVLILWSVFRDCSMKVPFWS